MTNTYSVKAILVYACLLSVVISIWSMIADPIINNDGILYVRAAKAISEGHYALAFDFHKWPFYSLLIAFIHGISSLSYEYSAHLINALCAILTIIPFVLSIRLYGGDRTTSIIGAFLITSFPGLNEIASFIIRDFGYIAAFTWSFYFASHYYLSRKNTDWLKALVCMLIAFLFRIEGLVFLLLLISLPFHQTIRSSAAIRWTLITAFVLSLFAVMGIYGLWLYTPQKGHHFSSISLQAVLSGWDQLIEILQYRIEILKTKVLNTGSNSAGRSVYFWTSIGIISTQIISLTTLVNFVFVVYALVKKLAFPTQGLMPLWRLFIFTNLGVLLAFTLTQLFLTDRYPLSLTITLLLCAPFALNHFYTRWKESNIRSQKVWGVIIILVLASNAYQGLSSFSHKRNLPEIAQWVQQNLNPEHHIYAHHKLLTNVHAIGYYSGFDAEDILVAETPELMLNQLYQGKWINYATVVLSIKSNPKLEEDLKKTIRIEPVKVFKGKGSREYRIYDIVPYRIAQQALKKKP